MKKHILLLVGLLILGVSYGQNDKKTEETKNQNDDNFTFKQIDVLDNKEGNLSIVGGKKSPSRKSQSLNSAKNSSSGIGETMGALSVSLTGAAQYNIPIAVPDGINGVVPEISLSYNSQGGNGLVGFGWNISGISTISRIPSTKFHDNQIDGVDFDNLDRFALDGERLVLKNGTYGNDGAQYETETYSNLKIVSYATSAFGTPGAPSYFIVYYPDGSFAHYGNSSDSRSSLNFSITYWQNPQGIRISYEYHKYGENTQSISKIKYGALNTSSPINEIKFSYKTNNTGLERFEQSFSNNLSHTRADILDKIEVFVGSNRFRSYKLSYNTSNLKYKRLETVTEYSGDGTLNHSPISFNYSNSDSLVSYNEITTSLGLENIEQRNAEAISLDMSGNGKMDFIVYPKTKNKFWMFSNIQSSGSNTALEANTGSFEAIFPSTLINYQNKVLSGQGLTLVQNGSGNQVKFKVYSKAPASSGWPIGYDYTKTWNAPTYNYYNTPTSSVQKKYPMEYLSGDFDGDGLTDVLAIGKPYTNRYCSAYECPQGVITNNPGDCIDPDPMNKIVAKKDEYAKHIPLNKKSISKDGKIIESFRPPEEDCGNGGGSSTCYTCSSYTANFQNVYFINLKRNLSTNFTNNAGFLQQAVADGDKLLTGDFNGDGKTDILHVNNNKYFIYGLNDNNVLTLLWQASNSGINGNNPILLGDYNGDGKTDFLQPITNNSNYDNYWFKTFLSRGGSFIVGYKKKPFKYEKTNWNGNNGLLTGCNLVPIDFNGDGKTDIIEYITTTRNKDQYWPPWVPEPENTQVIKIHTNIGLDESPSTTSNFKETNIEFEYGGSATKTGNIEHFPIPIFLSSNQPNKNLEFASISDKWVTKFSFTQDHREDVLIRSITNNGVTQTIDYSNLDPTIYNDDNEQVYQDTYSNVVYPYIDLYIAPSTKVVSKLQRISSGTTTLKQSYTYYGAVYNAEGLGFLGFGGVARSNWHTGYSDRIYNISKFDPSLRGALTEQYSMSGYFSFNTPSSGYISKTTNQYSHSLSSSKVFKLSLNSSLTQNILEGRDNNVSYLYDGYNNPTKITTDYFGSGTNVVDITYSNSTGSNYFIGRPSKQIETNTIGGETFKTEKQFIYSGYLLTQLKTKGDGTPFDIEAYNYDNFGNIIKKTITPNGETARDVEFEFDSTGRFLIKSTDLEGLETIYEYNINKGTLSKETNPFGHETNFTYDVWNRVIKVTDYLGNDVTTSYVESSYSYTVTNTGNDGSGAISIYDPLKRITTSKQKDVLGQWVTTNYQYDKFDRPFKVSEPFIGSSASQWNETEYDLYGRPIKLTEFTGKVTNITYSGLTTTVDDGTKTVTTTKDAMGNVTSVTDPGGTINYTYYGNGSLKSTNYNGVVVSLEQDGWGRKTKLTDPSAGIYEYSYNGFSEITNEITPKGTSSYTYSPIGKPLQKHITGDNTDMTIQYGYHATNKQLSSITQVTTDGNNASYSYTYDSLERIKKISENNAHAKFSKEYTYDTFGRINTEDYYAQLLSNSKSSSKKIKNIYQNGALKSIKDNATNQVISNLVGVNARGQVTINALGNGINEQNEYNPYGYLTTRKASLSSGSTTLELMSLSTDFNIQRGTLNSRTSNLSGWNWSENFTYDSMDRLVDFNDDDGDKNNSYDLLGRITNNSIIGDYNYTGNSFQVDDINLNNQGDLYYQQNDLQQITYNAFKKPFEINESGKEKIGFQYNAFMNRSHMFYGGTESEISLRNNQKHYAFDGSMEISHDNSTNITTFVSYIGGDGYNAPAIWKSEQGGATSSEYFYLHRDYLGSIVMITNQTGQVKEKRHFDAWGNIVKLSDGLDNKLEKFVYLDRGHTGHEHLQGAKLIHMNGRLYDPKLKRFLAPDNYIQNAGNTQNYNRYSYVLNNPLMYTDPSGETHTDPDLPGGWWTEGGGTKTAGIASAAYSIFNAVNWEGLRWNDIDNWATKNIFRPIQKMQPGKWIEGWFKKRSSAPIEYSNYEGLSSDPLAGTSMTIPPTYFGGGGDIGGLGVTQGYTPIDLKGADHQQILDGLINNIVQFQINKSENISSGKILHDRPNITNFVIQNMNIGELGGWKMIERNLKVENTDIYVQAKFPNSRTNPRQPEPEIIGFSGRTRKRGTVINSYNVYEIYLYTDPITKSGNARTYIGEPEALVISFSNLSLYNKTIKAINRRVLNGNN